MGKMAKRLRKREQKRLEKMTEEAKRRGGVSASLFLESEMNVFEDAGCFFFSGKRRRPDALLTVFFPDEGHAELTVAEYVPGKGNLKELFCRALRECKRVDVDNVHTVRNPACGFCLDALEGIRFTYSWSEYMLSSEMANLAREAKQPEEGIKIEKEPAPENDGSICYRLLQNGRETAECRILSAGDGTQHYLFGLKTKEEYRRKGMATALLTGIAKEYEKQEGAVLRLQVSSQNTAAYNLYQRLGFSVEEEREYYKTEEIV